MSSGTERMIEMQQDKYDRNLAKKLGITYDEIHQLDHEIDTEESNDGLVYNQIVRFSDNAPKEILDKVIGIENHNQVWLAPWELDNSGYYEEEYESIIANKKFRIKFQEEIENLERLNETKLEDKSLETILKRQIFIGVIETFETFLSDTFINLTIGNEEYFRNFVESYPDFRQRKFELRHLYVEQERIKETGKKIMIDIIYHDLPKISQMYALTFKIEFPSIGLLMKSILIRHNLVHRNGKAKDGTDVLIGKTAITDLIGKVRPFVADIADKLGL